MATETSQPGGPDGDEAAASDRRASSGRTWARAFAAAVLFLAGVAPRDAHAAADVGRGVLFFPPIGLAFGIVVGALAVAATAWISPILLAPAIVTILLAAQRGAPARALVDALAAGSPGSAVAVAGGSALLAAVLATEAVAIAIVSESALLPAIALAVMLGRWAMVVQVYGSIPAPDDHLAAAMTREAQFREFGIASVTTMVIALALANAVGLVLLFVAATVAIVCRIAAHRWRGGVTISSVLAGGEIVEVATLLVAAALARAIAA